MLSKRILWWLREYQTRAVEPTYARAHARPLRCVICLMQCSAHRKGVVSSNGTCAEPYNSWTLGGGGARGQFVSYPILSNPILSNPILSYPILSYPILSYPILSYPILSYPILSYPILSYPILSYRVVSYRIVSYRILSYPIHLML